MTIKRCIDNSNDVLTVNFWSEHHHAYNVWSYKDERSWWMDEHDLAVEERKGSDIVWEAVA